MRLTKLKNDAGCILIKSEGILDIGYKNVAEYVDCCIDQYEAGLKKSKRRGRTKRWKNPHNV